MQFRSCTGLDSDGYLELTPADRAAMVTAASFASLMDGLEVDPDSVSESKYDYGDGVVEIDYDVEVYDSEFGELSFSLSTHISVADSEEIAKTRYSEEVAEHAELAEWTGADSEDVSWTWGDESTVSVLTYFDEQDNESKMLTCVTARNGTKVFAMSVYGTGLELDSSSALDKVLSTPLMKLLTYKP